MEIYIYAPYNKTKTYIVRNLMHVLLKGRMVVEFACVYEIKMVG